MPGHKCGEYLPADLGDPMRRERTLLRDQLRQRTALDELHHDVRRVLAGNDVIDRRHPGMVDPGRGSRLAKGPLDRLGMHAGVGGGSQRQLLHRDLKIQQYVQPAVHNRGPAAANWRDKLVPARDKAVVGGSGHVMFPYQEPVRQHSGLSP